MLLLIFIKRNTQQNIEKRSTVKIYDNMFYIKASWTFFTTFGEKNAFIQQLISKLKKYSSNSLSTLNLQTNFKLMLKLCFER